MSKRIVEVFTAGCPLCDETVKRVRELACSNCDVQVWDLRTGCVTDECREKAAQYGIHRVPAVVVNGQLAECCQNQSPVSREQLIAAGLGQG
ncbi:thioredoxin family protein [Romeria aff. gracilis LEGE 07310]|uniref:Thioredoxin family protein n=1 Tax=Vasconcelosia minhoensis LEGE 07310 TaxID=915328 RepID=A0A8J7ASV6_9CYAN|nr:thioredoxin family protein [Romeria gracilis]MBE9079770.1 thioredoxin family protein [Romeria aff. gracilis LEGE 07310]